MQTSERTAAALMALGVKRVDVGEASQNGAKLVESESGSEAEALRATNESLRSKLGASLHERCQQQEELGAQHLQLVGMHHALDTVTAVLEALTFAVRGLSCDRFRQLAKLVAETRCALALLQDFQLSLSEMVVADQKHRREAVSQVWELSQQIQCAMHDKLELESKCTKVASRNRALSSAVTALQRQTEAARKREGEAVAEVASLASMRRSVGTMACLLLQEIQQAQRTAFDLGSEVAVASSLVKADSQSDTSCLVVEVDLPDREKGEGEGAVRLLQRLWRTAEQDKSTRGLLRSDGRDLPGRHDKHEIFKGVLTSMLSWHGVDGLASLLPV